MKLLIIYLLLINALGFAVMLADKYKAKKKLPRTPEIVLMGIAAIGGSIGSLLGMYLIRHKTKRWKFAIGIPILAVTQTFVVLFLLKYFTL